MQRAVALALGGDVTALRLCLDRLVATRRERPVQLPLPLLGRAEDVGDALDAITAAVASGEITPGEAAALVNFVKTLVDSGVLRWPRTPPATPAPAPRAKP